MAIIAEGSWLGSAVIAASSTLSLGSDKVPGSGVVSYHFSITHVGGGATTLAHVSRLRVKAGGASIVDISPLQLRAYLQRFSRGNEVLAANATTWSIPFYLPDEKGDQRYSSQFPPGQAPILEIDWTAGASAGDTVNVAWRQAPGIRAAFFPMILGENHNVPANSVRSLFQLNRGGLIRGLIIPTTGLSVFRATLTNVLMISTDGPLLQEAQRAENSETLTLADPIAIKFDEPMAAAVGASNLEFTTGAAWVATGEVCTVALVPLA